MHTFVLSSIILLLLAPSASADNTIETVVITATRTPQPQNETGESIDVITSQMLEAEQIDIVSDALAQMPGLTVNRNGGAGQPTAVSIRGAESGQSIVLLDGVRINDPSSVDDSAILQDLAVNNADRIEVLRGPQSTLYGSDAIGGVIDIVTKRGGHDPFDLTLTAEGGALDAAHLNAQANGTDGPVEFGAGVNWLDSRSVSAADSRNGNPEADPYGHVSATSNLRVNINDQLSFDLRGVFINGHTSFDDGFEPIAIPPFSEVADSKAYSNNQLFLGYAGLNYALFDGVLQNRFAVMATASNRLFFDSSFDLPGVLNFADYGETLRFEYQGVVEATDTTEITFGAETQRSGFRSNDFFERMLTESDAGRARITGYYLETQQRFFDQLTLTGGVRLDDISGFGTHTSLKFAGAWQVPVLDATLRGNYGDGFKAPSLFESFSVFAPPPEVPTLRPEGAKGWEIGADKPLFDGRVRASVTYFWRDTSNLIDFFTCFTPTSGPGCGERFDVGGYYFNEGRTRSSGIEAELEARPLDELTIAGNYTNLTAFDRDTLSPLARRPHVEANASLTWAPGPFSIGASMTYAGPRFDDTAATVPLEPVALFNLYGSYVVTPKNEVFIRIENLANTHYEPLFGYGAPARTAFAGVRVRL